jgi:hypothetical protein
MFRHGGFLTAKDAKDTKKAMAIDSIAGAGVTRLIVYWSRVVFQSLLTSALTFHFSRLAFGERNG